MALDLYRLINNPYAKVMVDLGQGGVVTSWLSEDQSFAFGNKFDAPFESFGSSISDIANKLSGAIGAISEADVGQAAAQVRVQNVLQTILLWTGSDRMAFSLKLIFVAVNPNDDVRQMVRPFIRATNPTYSGFVVTAPNNYNATGMIAQGAASIQIGSWFRSPPIFVVKSFNPTYSRTAITGLGSPLYCTADVQFEAYRMLSADEVENLFSISGA